MVIKELKTEEFDLVFSLLDEADLHYSDLKPPNVRLFLFEENENVIGVGGLEIFGAQALLRSVAVRKYLQKKGLGSRMVNQIEQQAKGSGISGLFLLTTTARGFFESLGYELISREDFPEALKQTGQFSSLCPVSAACMMKKLQPW